MSTVWTSDELVFKEYQFKCHSLKSDNTRMLLVRKNLLALNDKNEGISKSLQSIKTECELYRSHLYKTLFDQKVAADKQEILSRKKLDEFLQTKKRTMVNEYYKMSPIWFELEKLIKKNTAMEEECRKQANLLELTKQQLSELFNLIIASFQKRVCEFCQNAIEHDLVKLEMAV